MNRDHLLVHEHTKDHVAEHEVICSCEYWHESPCRHEGTDHDSPNLIVLL